MKSKQHSLKLGIISILSALALPLALTAATNPSPKKTVAPHLSGDLRSENGEIRVMVDINEYGFVTDAQITDSTNSELDAATLDAIYQWTFVPAQENGEAIASRAVQPFFYNDGSIVLEQRKTPQDKHPTAKARVTPQLSKELKHITGSVVLQANLDDRGTVREVAVKSSTHAELEEAASEALKKWRFTPAVKAGESVASRVIIPFNFEGNEREAVMQLAANNKSIDKAPVAIRKPTPELPREIRSERGEAKLKLTVDQHGYVAGVEIVESSNDGLSTAAREAALQWKFKPAVKDGVAVASTVIQPFSFNGGILTADLPVDSMPSVKSSKKPELPKALAQVQGFVKIRLDLDARGNVVNASCTKSSHDELIAPTMKAAKSWTFKPAVREGEKVPSTVVVPFVYNERS